MRQNNEYVERVRIRVLTEALDYYLKNKKNLKKTLEWLEETKGSFWIGKIREDLEAKIKETCDG